MPAPDLGAPLLAPMRRLLVLAAVLVFLAGVQLFVFPTRTPTWFAWTIDPPMTAAALGAAYWSSLALQLSAARSPTWAGARIAVPAVFVFTTLTLVVTLVHLDRFHLDATHGTGTRVVTWAWIGVYAVVPMLLAVIAVRQLRSPGEDPPRTRRLGAPVRWAVVVLTALFGVVGVALLVFPGRFAPWWPWALTPLTARAIGAWAAGLGVAGAHGLIEDDVVRVRPAAWAFVAFGALEGVALLRHGGDLDRSHPGTALFVGVLVVALAVGTAVLEQGRRTSRAANVLP